MANINLSLTYDECSSLLRALTLLNKSLLEKNPESNEELEIIEERLTHLKTLEKKIKHPMIEIDCDNLCPEETRDVLPDYREAYEEYINQPDNRY